MEIDDSFTEIERSLNIAGGIPVAGIFSGALRIVIGTIQSTASAIIGMIGLMVQLVSDEKKWEHVAHRGLEHAIHGALNIIRGVGEICIGVTIVGSPVLLLIRYKNNFEPYFKYTHASPLAPTRVVIVEG